MKTTNKKKQNSNQENLIPLKLSYASLFDVAQLAISKSPIVSLEALTISYKLFSYVDKSLYSGDFKSLAILEFIILALKARVVDRLTKQSLIIDYCIENNKKFEDFYLDLVEDMKSDPPTPKELTYVINSISKHVATAVIISHKDELQKVIDKFNANEFESTEQIIHDFSKTCGNIVKDIRNTVVDKSDTTLDTTRPDFKDTIKSALEELRKKRNRLNTGIIALNKMTNGGMENKRVYTIAAPPSGGKSLFALNLALSIKKYNEGPDMVQPDGAIPVVVFITHENTVTETIERLYGISVSDVPIFDSKESNDSIADSISKMIEYDPEVEGSIGIHLHYLPSNKHNVDDISAYLDKLKDSGYRPIALIHDYIKKIRPNYVRNDMRLDLAQVVDDFKNTALMENIPVLLLTQISRAGFSGMEEALRKNNPDALKDSSRTIIGESWGIVENSDWVTIALRVPNVVNDIVQGYHMSFLNTKARNGNQDMHFFFQPFDEDKPLKLCTDFGEKPLGKKSLLVTFDEMDKITKEEIAKGREELEELLKKDKKKATRARKSEIEGETIENLLDL